MNPITHPLQPRMTGAAVADLQIALEALLERGLLIGIGDPRRRELSAGLKREQSKQEYGAATAELVGRFQKSRGLPPTGAVDNATANVLNVLLVEPGVSPCEGASSESPSAWVAGSVRDKRGRGRRGLAVVLEHVRAGGRSEVLGRGTTDAAGTYRIVYDRAAAVIKLGERLNLRVGAGAKEAVTAWSAALLNAPARVQEFDVLVEAGQLDGSTDFERVRTELVEAAHQAGVDLTELHETPEQPDASLLAAETGIPVEKVVLLATAMRLERDSKGSISAELAFGLGSLGVPFGAAALVKTSRETLAAQVERAIEHQTVSGAARDQLDRALSQTENRMRALGLETVVKSPIGQVFADAIGADGATRFLNLAAQHSGDSEALWDKVAGDKVLGQRAAKLRFAAEATVLVGAKPEAVAMLRRLQENGQITDLSSLAAWTASTWEQQLAEAGVEAPGVSQDADDETRQAARRAYAQGLDHVVEATHARLYARHRVAGSRLPGREGIVSFLDQARDFSLVGTSLKPYLRQHPDLAAGLRANGDAERTLARLTRVARVARRAEPTVALVGEGLGSAQAIAGMGPKAFARQYQGVFGSEQLAFEAHARAAETAVAAAELLIEATPQGQPRLTVLPLMGVAELPAFPDWATLFGAADGCACGHCRSVTSPAAYLVDVLQFLKRRAAPARGGPTPLDVLRRPGRRPDLAEIELTCENTDTVLPYIDLVNEVLEDAIAPLPPFAPVVIAGPVATEPGRAVITTALRGQMNVALRLDGEQASFAVSADATLHALTEGQPWTDAAPAWRVEDRLATYTIRTIAATDEGAFEIASRGRNTRGPTALRLLSPQYLNAHAYDRLANAVYPWSLPFNRPLLEARVGLAASNSNLAEVLEAFGPGTPEQRRRRVEVVRERLGLSPVDAALVTWTQPAGDPQLQLDAPWRHWGFTAATASDENPVPDPADRTTPITAGDWVDLLASRLDVFMDRSQLVIEEVLALLDTRYVNPAHPVLAGHRVIELVSTDAADPATCRTRSLSLRDLDEAALIRMVRLVRLARRSGLSFREVDEALLALGAAEPDDTFLERLALLVGLRNRLGADWTQLAAGFIPASDPRLARYWTPVGPDRSVDHADGRTQLAPTLYERLFRPAPNAAPALRWFPSDPGGLAGLDLEAGLTSVAAAFGIRAADAAALIGSPLVLPAGAAGTVTAATLANLARLHRHALLLGCLGLTGADYLRALRLFDADPFVSPGRLAGFVATLDRAGESALTIEDLWWLTRRQSDAPEAVRTAADTQFLEALRATLKAVVADNRYVPPEAEGEAPTLDPDGAVTRSKLIALGYPAVLADAVVAALSDTVVREVSDPALPELAAASMDLNRYDVPLVALPAGVDLPSLSGGKLTHDPLAGQLRATARLTDGESATARLTDGERQALAAASPNEAYGAALAALFELQDTLAGRGRFDPSTRTLRFTGVMPALWRSHLDNLSALPAWAAAVTRLHQEPRVVARRVLRAWRLSRVSVPLATPVPVKLPPSYDGRLFRDQSVNPPELRLVGPLLPAELAALKAAAPSPGDPDQINFRAALDALEAAADAAPVAPADRLIAEATLDALLDAPITAAERYRRLLEGILPRVAELLADAALFQALGGALGLPRETAERLARFDILKTGVAPAPRPPAVQLLRDTEFVNSPAALVPNVQAFRNQHEVLRLLQQAALLAQRFALTAPDFEYLAGIADWPQLTDLPVEPLGEAAAAPVSARELLRFADYRRLRDRLPGGREALREIATAVAGGTATAALLGLVAQRLGRPEEEVARLAGPDLLDLSLPADLLDERGLLRLAQAFEHLDRLGVSASTVALMRSAPMPLDAGRAVISAVGAGMDSTQWRETGRGLFDQIRVAARDALLAYLLARGRPAENGVPGMRWRTPGEVFGHFLIDVEMGPCMETSRLRQAMSSVQLFVQRCQLGLEPEVVADPAVDDGWLEWEWMRTYRVWEANKKVFLHPENLLDHEFLDVKSQALRELEGDLGQGEVTIEVAARATLSYLQKLKALANLQPVTLARQAVRDGEVIHVLASMNGDPVTYYYRRREYTRIWSPWEKVELEIKSEHVVLHVWHNRPFLFWLNFIRQGDEPSIDLTGAGASLEGSTIRARQRFEVKLAWSELRDGQWSAQRQSRAVLFFDEARAGADTLRVVFRVEQEADGTLWIRLRHTRPNGTLLKAVGSQVAFRMDYPHAEPGTEARASFNLPAPVPGALYRRSGQEIIRSDSAIYPLLLPHEDDRPVEALRRVRRSVVITQSPSLLLRNFQERPFLVSDPRRAFMVTSSTRQVGVSVTVFPDLPDDFPFWFVGTGRLPLSELIEVPEVHPELLGPAFNPVREYVRVEVGLGGRPLGPGFPPEADMESLEEIRRAFSDDRRLANDTAAMARVMVARRTTRGEGLLDGLGLGSLAGDPAARPLSLRDQSAPAPFGLAFGAADLANYVLEQEPGNWLYAPLPRPGDVYRFPYFSRTLRTYRFEPFYHPYADGLIHVLISRGIEAMLAREVQLRPFASLPIPAAAPLDFRNTYDSVDGVVEWQHRTETLDFDYDGAYALYNWELCYHIPMLIADRLARSQRFEDARRWLHLIFDPRDQSRTALEENGTVLNLGSARYWRTKPLFRNCLPRTGLPAADDTVVERERIERILTVLAAAAAPDAGRRLTQADRDDLQRFRDQVTEMRRRPFRPHAIARLRTSAYQRAVVMKYLEILIRWGDQLFRRDTMETINAATQLYVLAAGFRGLPAPVMPPRAVAAPQTYASLEGRLDEGSNALVEIEAFVTPSAAPESAPGPGVPPPAMLAFCVPQNEKLERCWETIGDRLFKIHHCLNIDGVARKLALFEPPIDPALLARAVAAGMDIGAALADLDGPTPNRRFRVVIRQAAELAADVRALGASLLAAMEKRDGEMLAQMRAVHERQLAERTEEVRKLQLQEAEAAIVALRATRASALERFRHHRRLLGDTNLADPPEGATVPMRPARSDTATHDSQVFKLVAQLLTQIPGASQPPGTDLEGIPVTSYEDFELSMMVLSQGFQIHSSIYEVLAGIANVVPNFNLEPYGIGATFGGSNVGAALSAAAAGVRGLSGAAGFAASMAGRAGQFAGRADEHILQQNLAAREIMQIDRQILAADLRRQSAERELENQRAQIEDAAAYEEAVQGKFTAQALYDWMAGRLSDLYFQTYQLTYDWAKRAQRAARIELQRPQMDYIRFGQWDGLRKGLVAGESLALDIRRLELAYDEFDTRKEEMTKHVSLARTDPAALVRLRETGTATFTIPEALFDLDCPGQYLRCLKTVALTLPCVAGPYAGIHCRLTLLRSTIRVSSALAGRRRTYARDLTRDDPRFNDLGGQVQSIVTSSGQNDSGMFEASLHDPRYLAFEGLGAVSEWRVELPSAFRAFDYGTMDDLILHLRYTARNGGDALRGAVQVELAGALNTLEAASEAGGLARRFSLRHEAPSAWQRLLESPQDGFNVIELPIERQRLPFFVEGRTVTVSRLRFYAKVRREAFDDFRRRPNALGGDLTPLGEAGAESLNFSPWLGILLSASWAGEINIDRPGVGGAAPTPWRLRLQQRTTTGVVPLTSAMLQDVEVVVGYSIT
jgi:hypothetical protein